MSNLSDFLPIVAGGGVASIQTGYIASSTSTGTGEDLQYVDITISSVDVTKTVVSFVGGGGVYASGCMWDAGSTSSAKCLPRLTSGTNLRIACSAVPAVGTIAGRWTVVELN